MAKRRFKLTFRSTEVAGPEGLQRALIIAVAPTPVKGWLQAILAVEDGSMQQKAISQADFDLAERKQCTLLEVEDERAPPILYIGQNPTP